MEMAYIQAENLKHKRTFTKTLIVLAPFVTALMNFFAPLWFQLNSYNWWYILLYPGFLTLTCALIEQRDNGKLKYRAVASLPVSQNKVWKAKIGVAGIYSCVGNFIFLALNLLGGFAILVINEIPLTIGILNAGLGSVLGIFTATTSLWMICPYSWVPHLMISVLGILPNGEPVADQSTAMAFWMIILVLVISLAWFAALSFLTARWFEKKEVG